MNNFRKQAALTKFAPLHEKGLTPAEIEEQIAQDEKGYTEEEIKEIVSAITGEGEVPGDSGKGGEGDKGDEGQNGEGNQNPPELGVRSESVKPLFERWKCQVEHTDGKKKLTKLTLLKKGIRITEEQAETLNEGVLHGGNTYVEAYFLPE